MSEPKRLTPEQLAEIERRAANAPSINSKIEMPFVCLVLVPQLHAHIAALEADLAVADRVALVAEVIQRVQRGELITDEHNEILWATLEAALSTWRTSYPSDYELREMSHLVAILESAEREAKEARRD